MRFLSLFSGIEAASVAWAPLGWECVAFAEIAPFPCALLEQRFPGIPNLGNVEGITPEMIERLGPIDLVVGGFPCQDVSVAGARRGLEDDEGKRTRSGLFHEAMRIIRLARPRWTVIENVPGLLSSRQGRDFATVVGALAGCEFDVPDDGWGNAGVATGPDGLVEWATLDAQFFGVAQRRGRVFLVRDVGAWADRPPVLLEPESLRGDSPPRPKARANAPAGLARGAHRRRGGDASGHGAGVVSSLDCQRGGADDNAAQGGHLVRDVAPTLGHALGRNRGLGNENEADGLVPEIARTLNAGGTQRLDLETETLLPSGERPVPRSSRCVPELSGALGSVGDGGPRADLDRAGAMIVEGQPTPYVVNAAESTAKKDHARQSETARALDSTGGFAANQGGTVVAFPISPDADRASSEAKTPSADADGVVRLRDPGLGIGADGDPSFALVSSRVPAVAHGLRSDSHDASEDGSGRANLIVIHDDAPHGDYRILLRRESDRAVEEIEVEACADGEEVHNLWYRWSRGYGNQGCDCNRGALFDQAVEKLGYDELDHSYPCGEGAYAARVVAPDGRFLIDEWDEPFTFEARVARNGRGGPGDVVPPLKAESGETGKGDGAPLLAFRKSKRACNPDDYETWVGDGKANTLNAFDTGERDTHAIVAPLTTSPAADRAAREANLIAPLTGGGAPNSNPPGRRKEDDENLVADVSPALLAQKNATGGDRPPGTTVDTAESLIPVHAQAVADPVTVHEPSTWTHEGTTFRTRNVTGFVSGVRRLTPTECERLQGFPDGWTRIPYGQRAKAIEEDFLEYVLRQDPTLTPADVAALAADGPRYAGLGNSKAVPVVAWIGRQIARAHAWRDPVA